MHLSLLTVIGSEKPSVRVLFLCLVTDDGDDADKGEYFKGISLSR